jgi:hypothetical protein
MQKLVAAFGLLALVAACGGSPETTPDTNPGTNAITPADWLGPWNCTSNLTELCSTTTMPFSSTTSGILTFYSLGDAGIVAISSASVDACIFKFSLDGGSATLSNGPVMCGDTGAQFVYGPYTLSCDGGALSGAYDFTMNEAPNVTCMTSDTFDCTR